jgi:hypothetical protein
MAHPRSMGERKHRYRLTQFRHIRCCRTVSGRTNMSSPSFDAYARWVAGALVALGVEIVPALAWGGAPLPDPQCTTNEDCPGCAECNAQKQCIQWSGTLCFCHEECIQAGKMSCALMRPSQPKCGGYCSDAPANTPLACGQDADTLTPETLDASLVLRDAVAPAAKADAQGMAPLSANDAAVDSSSMDPEVTTPIDQEAGGGHSGCSCHLAASPDRRRGGELVSATFLASLVAASLMRRRRS